MSRLWIRPHSSTFSLSPPIGRVLRFLIFSSQACPKKNNQKQQLSTIRLYLPRLLKRRTLLRLALTAESSSYHVILCLNSVLLCLCVSGHVTWRISVCMLTSNNYLSQKAALYFHGFRLGLGFELGFWCRLLFWIQRRRQDYSGQDFLIWQSAFAYSRMRRTDYSLKSTQRPYVTQTWERRCATACIIDCKSVVCWEWEWEREGMGCKNNSMSVSSVSVACVCVL